MLHQTGKKKALGIPRGILSAPLSSFEVFCAARRWFLAWCVRVDADEDGSSLVPMMAGQTAADATTARDRSALGATPDENRRGRRVVTANFAFLAAVRRSLVSAQRGHHRRRVYATMT